MLLLFLNLRKLYILFILLVGGSANAVSWNATTDFLWNAETGKINVFPGAGAGNVWAVGETKAAQGLGVALERPKLLPFTPGLGATGRALFKPSAIAKAVLNPTGAIITLAGAALIARAIDQACLNLAAVAGKEGQIVPNQAWNECKFKDSTIDLWKLGGPAPQYAYGEGTTAIAAANMFASSSQSLSGNQWTVIGCSQASATNYLCHFSYVRAGWGEYFVDLEVSNQPTVVKQRDGWQPASQEEALSKLQPVLEQWSQADFLYGRNSGSGDLQQVLDSVMKSGNSVDLDSISTSGPASAPAGTTTSISSDGTTTTKTVQNNYTYNNAAPYNSVVTVTQTTVNNVTNTTTGATTTTTTTTDKPADPIDPCDKNPDRLGCQKVEFDAPEVDIPKTTKQVTYQAENLGFGGGSCPADKTMTLHGRTVVVFNWADSCSKITTYAKPMILALSTFAALMIIFSGKIEA